MLPASPHSAPRSRPAATHAPRCFALIPAAGTGSRSGAQIPKQYLRFGARTMLQWSVDALAAMTWIEQTVVIVAAGDTQAAAQLAGRSRVRVLAVGGASRRDTVFAGLLALAGEAASDDWVLVHDAARPGIEAAALERLRSGLAEAPAGGLLALPLRDTVKRAAGPPEHRRAPEAGSVHQNRVDATLDRSRLWIAQTPQMFRFGLLSAALSAHRDVTDEAAAMERAGHVPWLIEGAKANFKVTDPDDIALMRLVLAVREPSGAR